MARFFLFSITLFLGIISCKNAGSGSGQVKDITVSDSLKSKTDLTHIKVGYCTPSLNAPFYVVLSQYIKKYATGYGMNFVMADGQDDILKQITSTEDMVVAGLDILILNPLDHKALIPAVNAAAKSGVPVFIVDSQIDPAADYITSIQASNEGNGELIGEWAVKQLGGGGLKVAIISGSQGNPVGRAKRLGFIEGYTETQLMISGYARVQIVAQGWGNWTLLGGLEAMEDILTAHPDVNLLVAENDAMGMGALKAIEEAGKSSSVTVVGYDGQKEACELIKQGKFGATALNSPKELARLTVESVVRYLNGERLNKIIHTPAVVITKDNVDQYYDPDALF